MNTGDPTTITAYPDGPLIVRGNFTVHDLAGEQIEVGPVVALCRCGRSARKPLCDGTHHRPLSASRARDADASR